MGTICGCAKEKSNSISLSKRAIKVESAMQDSFGTFMTTGFEENLSQARKVVPIPPVASFAITRYLPAIICCSNID